MSGYNEKRVINLEETKAKDFIQHRQQEELAKQARLDEAERAKGPVRAPSRLARGIAVFVIFAVVAALLV